MAASEQGAYLTWNHPGWKLENNIPVWKKRTGYSYAKRIIKWY